MYGFQQQLAKLHENLEKSQESYNNARRIREEAEIKLQQITANYQTKHDEVEQYKLKCKFPLYSLFLITKNAIR